MEYRVTRTSTRIHVAILIIPFKFKIGLPSQRAITFVKYLTSLANKNTKCKKKSFYIFSLLAVQTIYSPTTTSQTA